MKFLLFSDLHHGPCRFPGRAEGALEEFLEAAKRENCDFIIHAGDLCGGPTEVPEYVEKYNNLDLPTYHCIGNHDADHSSYEDVLRLYGLENDYYYFDRGSYRFIVMNPNYYLEDGKYIHYSMSNYYGKSRDHVPPEQLLWLSETIESSPFPCVIISYQSFERETGVKNRQDVLNIINEANKRRPHSVIFCINGHTHGDYLRILNGVCFFDINSASNLALDNPHKLYPCENDDEYRHSRCCVMYTDKIYAIITLEGTTIDIKGMDTTYYLGITPEMTGNSVYDDDSRAVRPSILSANIEL